MGPWGEPELLVWRPEAVSVEPLMPVGLEVKLGALALLLVLTLICSLVPICVLRRPGAHAEASGEPLLFPAVVAWGREGSGWRKMTQGGERVAIAWVGVRLLIPLCASPSPSLPPESPEPSQLLCRGRLSGHLSPGPAA